LIRRRRKVSCSYLLSRFFLCMSAATNNALPPDSGGNWRKSIAQSFRSEEVRSIAKVLASLEPGATSASKTM